jgi:hypothetical protein
MLKRLGKVAQKAVLAAGGVLVALIVLEIGVRWLPLPYDDAGDTADVCSNQTGWRGKPDFKTTVATDDYVHNLTLNSLGMHDGEHTRSKAPDTFRILMLGDSFVRAHQVKEVETSHQVLEDLLNEHNSSRHFEVISAGVDGWGTGQELLYYRSEGRFYQPDLVLLMLYIGNDIKDNLPPRGLTFGGRTCYAPYFVLCGDQLDPEPWLVAPGVAPAMGQCPAGKKIWNNLLGKLYQSSRLYAQIEPLLRTSAPDVSALDFYTQNNGAFDYGLRLTLDLVRQLDTEVKGDGARFAVVLISPSDLIDFTRMNPAQREEVYQRLPFMRQAEEIDPPNQLLADDLARAGIQTLDLLPAFVAYVDQTGDLLRFEQDKHWNVAGNRLAGESIYHWLQESYRFQ